MGADPCMGKELHELAACKREEEDARPAWEGPVRGMGHAQAMQVKPCRLEGAHGPGRRNGPDLGLLGLMGLGPI